MISKSQINIREKKKSNPEILETIKLSKKNNLMDLAKKLSAPRRLHLNINLTELDNVEGTKVMVVGKVLGSGNINKKISVSALGFSKQASEKLKSAGCEIKTIKQEIESNKDLKGVKII